MPIPLPQLEESQAQRLRIVPRAAPGSLGRLLYPRAIAHFIDFCVVQGTSLYSAKLCSVVLVSFHARAITGSGRTAAPLFLEAFSYSSTQLLAASFAALALVYFVALPLAIGRTLGMGLLGLRIRAEHGEAPNVRQLALRMLGCALNYGTLGILCVTGLRKRNGRFLQDDLSGTMVEKE